jgi:hypothetical protein
MCYLHLVEPLSRGIPMGIGEIPIVRGAHTEMRALSSGIKYYVASVNQGVAHVRPMTVQDGYELLGNGSSDRLMLAKELFRVKCRHCSLITMLPDNPQHVIASGCTGDPRCYRYIEVIPTVNQIGWELGGSSDIDSLMERPGALSVSSIEDPEFLTTNPNIGFDLKIENTRSWPKKEYTELGGNPETVSKQDCVYQFDLVVSAWNLYDINPEEHKRHLTVKRHTVDYEKLCSIRHDFVATRLMRDTDQSLRSLGIASKRTPDVIDVKGRAVLELATNGSGQPKSMESSYASKRLAYESICKDYGVNYYVLVVSPSSVLTNFFLTPFMAEELSSRCRIGLSLETLLETEFDIRLTSVEDDGVNRGLIDEILSNFSESTPLPEHYHFNRELIDLQRPATELEEEHTRSILNQTLKNSLAGRIHRPDASALKNYLLKFKDSETQKHPSQISQFPFVVSEPSLVGERGNFKKLGTNKNTPEHLFTVARLMEDKFFLTEESLWSFNSKLMSDVLSREVETHISAKKYNLVKDRKMSRHVQREDSKAYPVLGEKELLSFALKGVGAKELSEAPEVVEKEARKKRSFHPEVNTLDIEKFWSGTDLMIDDDEWQRKIREDPINKLLRDCKEEDPLKLTEVVESSDLHDLLFNLKNVQMGELISDIVAEISMEYKVPTKPGEWLIKPLRRFKAILYLVCTGTHTFYFLALDKSLTHILDTGNLGPEIFETENYYITNVSSVTEATLEHFVKAGPYLELIAVHLLQSMRVPVLDNEWSFPSEFCLTFNYLTLTYLNNKLDHEELLTNLRFLHMKLLQEVGATTCDYVERLPGVLRSRLTAFSLKRVVGLMKYYDESRVIRKKIKTPTGPQWEYQNLRVIYHNSPVTTEQMIDSFYYSYVVTKNKSAMGDHTFKIFEKVFKEQIKGHEEVELKGEKIWGMRDKPLAHCWDFSMERLALETSEIWLKEKHGPNVKKLMEKEVYKTVSRFQFSELTTLKASAKDYSEGIVAPPITKGMTRKEYSKEFKKLNKKIIGKRPKVITKVVNLVEAYKEETKDMEPTVLGVATWALKDLLSIGYVLCDLFIKDQHNGVREIHVLDVRARLIMYVVEQIAKTINRFFENDSVANPDCKKRFYLDHEKDSSKELGQYITLCTSADASKWCQRNHVSQFFFDLLYFAPKEFHPFIYCVFYLWTKKRIALSWELIDNLDRNRSTYSTNPAYIKMRELYHSGESPFLEPRGGFIENPFGMWQGIPHNTSCLKHNVQQLFWKMLTRTFLTKTMTLPNVVTIVQGSDDSGAMISTPSANHALVLIVIGLLWWKVALGRFASIWTSLAKSAIGTTNLIEYNSEWWFNGRNIKPVFRMNSACLETSLTERLAARPEQFYNALTQSLEAGSNTLTCAVIQLLQARLHYSLIGLGSHLLSKEAIKQLKRTKNVSLGYYPLEVDQLAGITGFDYQLYLLTRRGVVVNNWEVEQRDDQKTIEYDSKIDKIIHTSLRNYQLKFSNIQNYLEVLKKTKLPKLADVIERISKNPELLYMNLRTWEQEEIKMIMILDNPSVRSSLSSHQPTARMMSSSSYLLNTPCVTARDSTGGKVKRSLLSWLRYCNSALQGADILEDSTQDKIWFVNQDQYSAFTDFMLSLKNSVSTQKVSMRRANRVEVHIWGNQSTVEVPLIDVLKRKWFYMRTVHCSNEAFNEIWNSYCVRYPFLRNTYKETLKVLDMEDVSAFKLFQSITEKTRTVRLSDTTSKKTDTWNIASRLFWPDIKVRASHNPSEVGVKELKNSLHCILSYFFKKSFSLQLCIDLIKGSDPLKKETALQRDTTYRLKIFHDFLLGVDKMKLIDDIGKGRLGTLGYFSKRQTTTPTGYTGTGEWVGIIQGVPTRITMFDKCVTSVKVKRLGDLVQQGRVLKQLIREFGLEFKEAPPKSYTSLYLTSSGHIERSPEAISNSTSFLLDRTMDVDVTAKLMSQKWFMDAEGDTLRLCFTETTPNHRTQKFTILSESFTAFHWDPLLPVVDLCDESFSAWCRGAPCKPMSLMHQILIPLETVDVALLSVNLERKTYYRPETPYDIRRFLQVLRQMLDRKVMGKTFSEMKYDYIDISKSSGPQLEAMLIDDVKLSRIKDNTLNFLRTLEEEGKVPEGSTNDNTLIDLEHIGTLFDDPGVKEGEEVASDDTTTSYSETFQELDDDALQEIAEMFSEGDSALEQIRIHQQIGYRSNIRQVDGFLGPYLDVFDDMPESLGVLSIIKDNKPLSNTDLYGPGGALIRLLYKDGNYRGSKWSQQIASLEAAPMSDFISQSSAMGLSSLDLHTLKQEQGQIEGLLPALSGPILHTMSQRLQRIRAEISYQESKQLVSESSSLVPLYDKKGVLIRIYRAVVAEGFWNTPTLHPNEQVMVEVMVSYAIDSLITYVDMGLISAEEAEMARAGAWSSVLSEELLKAICLYLGLSMTLKRGGQVFFNYSRGVFRESLSLDV